MKAFVLAAAIASFAVPALAAETMTRDAQSGPSMQTAQSTPASAMPTRDAQPMAGEQAMPASREAAPARVMAPVVGL